MSECNLEAAKRYVDDQAVDEEPVAATEVDAGTGPDDALGLYLRQMGSIPLLTREQELTLARRLETARRRYRRAILFSWLSLRTSCIVHSGVPPRWLATTAPTRLAKSPARELGQPCARP